MNNKEYWSTCKSGNKYYKLVHKLLNQWKHDNNIKSRCCIHHRDDNEECRKYNEEHYELWGFNEDGTFELGKYVIFMTSADHAKHHNQGCMNPMYKHEYTEETRQKMSESGKKKIFSDEHREHLSEACKGTLNGFYGKHHSAETRLKMCKAHENRVYKPHSQDTKQLISIKRKAYWDNLKMQFMLYKEQHPESNISIKEFQRILKQSTNR